MKWPSRTIRKQICQYTNDELPGCVGYLDGTEIRLSEAPTVNHEDYFSRTHQYSIKMQAICNFNLQIIYITIGYPGIVFLELVNSFFL